MINGYDQRSRKVYGPLGERSATPLAAMSRCRMGALTTEAYQNSPGRSGAKSTPVRAGFAIRALRQVKGGQNT